MCVSETGVIAGKIVYLSSLKDSDSETLFGWINDRELVLSSAPFRPVSQKDHQEWFRSIRTRNDVSIFGIRLTAGDDLVGTCQLHSLNSIHRSAELQIRIGRKDMHGKGIGTEACLLLLNHAFSQMNLHRVYLHVFENNKPALKVYDKCGFRREGILKEAALIDGAWLDVVVMGILKQEFMN